MIEVLVAMIIISVGLLGVAGLFAESQKNIQEVQQRSIALLLAEDILARMNANMAGAEQLQRNIDSYHPLNRDDLCDQSGSNCSPATTAALQIYGYGASCPSWY